MMRRLLLAVVLCSFCLVSVPVMVQAKDLFSGTVCQPGGDTKDSAVCTDNATTDANQDPFSGDNGLLIKLTNIVAYIGGAAAVIMIFVSALKFVTSGSDLSTNSRTDTDVESARHTLANAVLGLIIIVLGREIILFVLSRL